MVSVQKCFAVYWYVFFFTSLTFSSISSFNGGSDSINGCGEEEEKDKQEGEEDFMHFESLRSHW